MSNKNQTLIDGLRALADKLEAHDLPEIQTRNNLIFFTVRADNPAQFRQLAEHWGQKAELKLPKDQAYPLIALRLIFGVNLNLDLYAAAEGLCKQVEKEETVTSKRWELVEPIFDEAPRGRGPVEMAAYPNM